MGKAGGNGKTYLYVHLIEIITCDRLSLPAWLLARIAELWQAGQTSSSPGSLKKDHFPI